MPRQRRIHSIGSRLLDGKNSKKKESGIFDLIVQRGYNVSVAWFPRSSVSSRMQQAADMMSIRVLINKVLQERFVMTAQECVNTIGLIGDKIHARGATSNVTQ